MTLTVQTYRQGPGACEDDGSVMEPGWYFVFERTTRTGQAPYGRSYGPYRNAARAEAAGRRALRARLTYRADWLVYDEISGDDGRVEFQRFGADRAAAIAFARRRSRSTGESVYVIASDDEEQDTGQRVYERGYLREEEGAC